MYSFCAKSSINCGGKAAQSEDQDLCWTLDAEDINSLYKTFPVYKVFLGDDMSVEYEWKPEDYLYRQPSSKYCIGITKYE